MSATESRWTSWRSASIAVMLILLVSALAATFLNPQSDPEPSPTSEPGIYVSGNALVDGSGDEVVLHGVNKSGSEYACIDGWGFFDGPADQASIEAMKSWQINAVRIPLNSACWLDLQDQFSSYNSAFSGDNYRAAIEDYVDLLNRNGIYTILALQWTGCGSSPCKANWLKPLPDRPYAAQFWTSVATAFKDNQSVLFDLFNEPQGVGWDCWKSGGCTAFDGDQDNQFTAEGMQPMIDSVRQAGASRQPILLGGLQYANDMDGWLANLPNDPSNSIAASIHLYNTSNPCPLAVDPSGSAEAAIRCFTDDTLNSIDTIAKDHPVVFGELGQDNCGSDFITPMLEWMQARGYSSLGWAWNTHDCSSFPALISDYSGTPTAFGQGFKDFYTANPAPAAAHPPMQMISLGKPAFASSGAAGDANDADYDTLWRPDDNPAWLAYDLSTVPAAQREEVVLAWYAGVDDGYSTVGLPGVCPAYSGRQYLASYAVEANSSPGGGDPPTNGWVVLHSVGDNAALSSQHLLDFRGYNWIRVRGTGPNQIAINVDVADASAGVSDGWLFLGDSITAAYAGHGSGSDPTGATVGSFTDLISAGTDGQYRPISQNSGTACAKAADATEWIDPMLNAFPGRYVTLNFGTNDGWGGTGDPAALYQAMETLVAKVSARGKVPVVATIPWPNNPGAWAKNTQDLNEQIRRLYREHPEVVQGPDLYTLLEGRSDLFRAPGDVHPNEQGAAVIRTAWADAMLRRVYHVTE